MHSCFTRVEHERKGKVQKKYLAYLCIAAFALLGEARQINL